MNSGASLDDQITVTAGAMSDRLRRCQVQASKRLLDAMQALEQGNVQIAFVCDQEGRVIGTLTDGDIRRALLRSASLESPLEPFVQRKFISVGPQAGRAEVLELMQARTIGQIPVLDGGRLVGLHLLHEMLGTFERDNWAVILAGGRGTRLRPLTEHVPKAMIPVAGRPILERLVLHLVGYGIRRIFLAVNYMAEVIEKHFEDGRRLGCRIEYLREDKPLGTGGALSLLQAPPTSPLLALNGDLVAQFDVDGLLQFHERGAFAATVAITEYTHTVPLGVTEVDGERLTGIQEKPTFFWKTNAGIYVLRPDLLLRVPRDTEYHLPTLIADCLERNEPVGAFPIEGDWIDVGRTRELDRARGQVDGT